MIYLLSTQCMLDLLTGEPDMVAWIKNKPASMIEVCSVSIGQGHSEIAKETNTAFRKALEASFEKLLLGLRLSQGIVAFDESASKVWATLSSMSLIHDQAKELSPESRMVVAVALTRNATFVDRPRPYHAQLAGLKVQSP